MGTLERGSITYSHITRADGTTYRDRFDGVWAATPLGELMTLGAGLEFARAPDSDGGDAASTKGLTLGSALSPSPYWSLGSTYRMRWPRDGEDHLRSADLALTVTPTSYLGMTAMVRDLASGSRTFGARTVRESALLAIAVRPTGDDRVMLEAAGRTDAKGDLGARVAGQVIVPRVGRLGAAGELTELAGRHFWTFTAGLDLRWGGVSIAPAVHVGEKGEEVGWSMLADMHAQPRIGLPRAGYVAKVPLRGLGTRGLLAVSRTLERAVRDPAIVGVVLAPEGAGAGLATAQELRMLVSALERAGKPVYCHLQSASGAEFYACAGARRVTMDPSGMIRLMGLGGQSLYFGDLLANLGLRADFVRIGRYKSAPEQYTNAASSEETREVRKSLLDGAYRRLLSDLSGDLGRDEDALKALIDRGPFLAQEAERERLVAATLDRHDLERDAREVFGSPVRLREPAATANHPRFGPAPQIGVVLIDGTIVDGENVDVPFLGVHMSGGRTVSESIDKLANDRQIGAIVLRIDSPGGAVMASDQIYRAVQRARAKKPVIASMGDVAASGGYYAAAGASEIWADPSTITGSIGIFYGKIDVSQLAARIGVGIESDGRGAHAGSDSVYRPFSDEERAALAEKLRIWYRQFIERVSEGRKLPIERVDELARGRVYSGDEAQALGLVDSLGGFASALARARTLAEVREDAELVVLPKAPGGLLDLVLSGGVRAESAKENLLPTSLKALIGQLYPWLQISPFEPMALYDGPLRLE